MQYILGVLQNSIVQYVFYIKLFIVLLEYSIFIVIAYIIH